MYQQIYRFGPFTLQVQVDERQQQMQLDTSWQQLFRLEPTAAPGDLDFKINLAAAPVNISPADLPAHQLLATFGQVAAWRTATGWLFTCGATQIEVQSGQRQATGYLAADFGECSLVEQRDFWLRIFARLVRQAEGYMLHANALYHPKHGPAAGLLLVGDCGSGKTTLTLSLISAGWGYVTDDSVLMQTVGHGLDSVTAAGLPALAPANNAILAHAVRRGFACTAQTVAQWPWLAHLQAIGTQLNRAKTLVDLDSLYPTSFAPACWPRLLLFPHITGDEQSRLTRLSTQQSFTTLLGQPRNGLLVDPATTPRLLAHFKTLVQQAQGYQLHLGTDVFTQPDRVSALFTRAAEAA